MKSGSATTRRASHRIFLACFALAALMPGFTYSWQVRDRDPEWVAPPDHVSKPNPLASRTDVIAGGRKVFRKRCATCHGDGGRGTSKAPDLTDRDVQTQSDDVLYWKISSGNTYRGMPAFSFLPEPQRWQLVLHLRALATVRSPSD